MAELDSTIFYSALQNAVDILESESVNITCILVNEAAASLYCAVFNPEIIHIVVIPQNTGLLSVEDVSEILIRWDPIRFQFNGSQLQYCEPSIHQPKKNWCQIVLIPVPNPPPPPYAPSCVQRLEELPVASPLPVVFDAIHDLQTAPEKERTDTLLQLLNSVSKHDLIPIDDEFHCTLLGHLQRVADFSAEFQQATSRFIRFCQGERFEISETVDDGPLREGKPEDVEVLKLASLVLDPASPIKEGTDADRSLVAVLVPGELQERKYSKARLTTHSDVRPLYLTAPNAQRASRGGAPATHRPIANPAIANSLPSTSSSVVPQARRSNFNSHEHRNRKKADAGAANLRVQVTCIIARRVVDFLHGLGVECALFGGLAIHLYGNQRVPNGIDLLTQPPRGSSMTQKSLKEAIQAHDSHFFLQDAVGVRETYQILYFRVDRRLAPSGIFRDNKCKVDIVMPGTMHLPSLIPSMIEVREFLPLIPYSVLLLHKVQAWDDHRNMTDTPHKYNKHRIDADDVLNLLKLDHVAEVRVAQPWADRTLFSEEFMALSMRRVREFYVAHPKSQAEFVRLGF